jgi:hypothetical protein
MPRPTQPTRFSRSQRGRNPARTTKKTVNRPGVLAGLANSAHLSAKKASTWLARLGLVSTLSGSPAWAQDDPTYHWLQYDLNPQGDVISQDAIDLTNIDLPTYQLKTQNLAETAFDNSVTAFQETHHSTGDEYIAPPKWYQNPFVIGAGVTGGFFLVALTFLTFRRRQNTRVLAELEDRMNKISLDTSESEASIPKLTLDEALTHAEYSKEQRAFISALVDKAEQASSAETVGLNDALDALEILIVENETDETLDQNDTEALTSLLIRLGIFNEGATFDQSHVLLALHGLYKIIFLELIRLNQLTREDVFSEDVLASFGEEMSNVEPSQITPMDWEFEALEQVAIETALSVVIIREDDSGIVIPTTSAAIVIAAEPTRGPVVAGDATSDDADEDWPAVDDDHATATWTGPRETVTLGTTGSGYDEDTSAWTDRNLQEASGPLPGADPGAAAAGVPLVFTDSDNVGD